VQQLLTESVLLSLVGGALGILFAIWSTRSIVTLFTSSSDEPFGFSPGIDERVLLFTFGAAVLTGIIFGLAPAFRGTRIDLTPALKEGARGSAGGGRAGGRWFSLGNGLVITQVALAVVVLVGAGLLVRTLRNLRNVDPGFDTRNLLTFRLDPTLIGYKTPQIDAFYSDLQQRIAAIPGVESVSYSNSTLLSGSLWDTGFHLEGAPKDQESNAAYLPIGDGFFSMMHMRLLSGRNFNSADFTEAEAAEERERTRADVEKAKDAGLLAPGANAAVSESAATEPPVPVIVNKTFVQKYFPKVNPLGVHFGAHEADPAKGDWASPGWEILGVVSDAKYQDLRSPVHPTMYVPSSGGNTSFEVRRVCEWLTKSGRLPLCRKKSRAEVNRLSPTDRFLIAWHSPWDGCEVGLLKSEPEKNRDMRAEWPGQSHSLRFDLLVNCREIRAYFASFGCNAAEFLCSSDCLAERVGFELAL
jgi:hypothetical protein